jgi:hypothetical protein
MRCSGFELCGTDRDLTKKPTGEKPKKANNTMRDAPRGPRAQNPGWASGLRQIYDSVVDEPLPDTFRDLLSKLDSQN